MSWSPIYDNREVVTDSIRKIHQSIGSNENSFNHQGDSSLMYGQTGIAIFYGHAYQALGDDLYFTEFNNTIERLLTLLETPGSSLNFGQGYPGIAWGLTHLAQIGLIDEPDGFFDELEPFMVRYAKDEIRKKNYDFLLGGLGYPNYLLYNINANDSRTLLAEYTNELASIAVRKDGLIYWEQFLNDGPKRINLGLAHGLPSIMLFLSRCYRNDINPDICMELIEGGMAFMKENQMKHMVSIFSYSVSDDETPVNSSIRWCYGDLGIGLAFIQIGKNCGVQEWTDLGVKLGLNCSTRTREFSMIADAHLCHGTGGTAHMLNRYYHYTGIEDFKTAAITCYDLTLQKAILDKDTIGWLADKGDFGNVVFDGLLEGNTGIGLALLASIGNTEPGWDEALLLS
ncbi:MAG: lanthionine synthetase C family protein [Bacteroidota bacterium]